MKTVLLATPFLSNHFDAGLFWLNALGRERVPAIAWDYRRDPDGMTNKTECMLALKTPPNPDSFWYEKVCYWPDALGRDPASEALLAKYDRVYTCLRPTPEGMIWLPTGWDPTIHFPRLTEKMINTLFIGTATDRKRTFLEALPPMPVFGNGWGPQIEPAYLEDYCQLLSRARISVNVHRDDIGLNRRFFESMACTFTLTDIVPGVTEVLGLELAAKVGFRTPAELAEKNAYFLEPVHEQERLVLWKRELEAIAPYTYDAAVRKVLELD